MAKRIDSALKLYPDASLSISGGVAANSHLRARLTDVARKNKREIHIPDLSLCGDNAAMIGCQAYYEYLAGVRGGTDLNAVATMKLDEVTY